MQEIFHRTSIRTFHDKEVESEKIIEMLQAAMAAPSACNQQPWEFYVVTNSSLLAMLAEAGSFGDTLSKAPMAFVACFRTDCLIKDMIPIDMGCCLENLLLEADHLDLGAVFLGVAPREDKMDKIAELLDMPKDLKPFAIVPVGYPTKVEAQENRFDESRIHYID